MDLKSGLPFWLIKNGLSTDYVTLDNDIDTEILIIGSGITGALCAHFLCEAGIKCIIVDKRMSSTGSTTASTAQLQYEIDTFLFDLIEKIGEENAVKAYKKCLESIYTLEKIIKKLKIDGDFEWKSSLYLASNYKGFKDLQKEYEIRKKHEFPVTFLNQKQLKDKFNINKKGALYNECSAQIDTFKLCKAILNYHKKNSELVVYSHTNILKIENKKLFLLAHTEKKIPLKLRKL